MIIGGADQIWHTIGSRQLQGKRTRYEALARAAVGDARFEAEGVDVSPPQLSLGGPPCPETLRDYLAAHAEATAVRRSR